MVDHGFKVAVIEQTETPRMLEERQKRERANKTPVTKAGKCCARAICNMVTKGTYKAAEQTYMSKYVMAIKKHGNEFGVTFFDVTTLEIYIGQFTDDDNMSALRTLICQIRPVEVIHEREIVNSDVIKMLKNSPCAPVFTPLPVQKCYSFVKTCTMIEKYFGENVQEWPEPLRKFKEADKDLAFNSFGMSISFLTDALIDEQTLRPGLYKEYSVES